MQQHIPKQDIAEYPGAQGYVNYNYQMPAPQYLGAKYKLLPWICSFIPDGVNAVFDGFAGSQSFAYEMKRRGLAVHTNDFLSYCHTIGIALIENKDAQLTADDLDTLFVENETRATDMMRFKDIFFVEDECVFLDNFRTNVDLLNCPYKRALALAVMCRSLTRKTTMGHFAHLCALRYANDPERIRRNRSIARPIRDLFMEILPTYNAAVFDNGQHNQSYRQNTLEFLQSSSCEVDVAYYDPPYCGSHADYQAFYHLLETFIERWSEKTFVNRTQRYHPLRHSGFDKIAEVERSLRRLFELSDAIPYWLISYNNRSVPNVETIAKLAGRHKKVHMEEKSYVNSRGGKGSVAGSREFLLVCE